MEVATNWFWQFIPACGQLLGTDARRSFRKKHCYFCGNTRSKPMLADSSGHQNYGQSKNCNCNNDNHACCSQGRWFHGLGMVGRM